jgi:hypothetical protein
MGGGVRNGTSAKECSPLPLFAYLNTSITHLLIALFSTTGAALMLATIILLCAIGILIAVYYTRVGPLQRSLFVAITDFPKIVDIKDLTVVDGLMTRPGRKNWRLGQAWSEYRSGFLLSSDGHLRSGAPAWHTFEAVSPETAVLGWWSNLFVAIGLILTFLGVVAALSEATSALGSSNDAAVMQGALSGLLTITATKFWTSIAGVFASVLMRIFERRWTQRIERMIEDLCRIIDQRVMPVTPGIIAGEQLAEIRAQTKLLTEMRDALVGGAQRAEPARAQRS